MGYTAHSPQQEHLVRTAGRRIATSAVSNILGCDQAERARSPQTMADAAMVVLSHPPAGRSGAASIESDVLTEVADPVIENLRAPARFPTCV